MSANRPAVLYRLKRNLAGTPTQTAGPFQVSVPSVNDGTHSGPHAMSRSHAAKARSPAPTDGDRKLMESRTRETPARATSLVDTEARVRGSVSKAGCVEARGEAMPRPGIGHGEDGLCSRGKRELVVGNICGVCAQEVVTLCEEGEKYTCFE